MVAAFALPAMAQFENTQPSTTVFQSTSTMMGSGSAYSATPTLNEDGTASLNGTSGSHRAKKNTPATPGSPSTPGQGKEENQFPLGDALFPLLVMALAFAGITYFRRKRLKAGN